MNLKKFEDLNGEDEDTINPDNEEIDNNMDMDADLIRLKLAHFLSHKLYMDGEPIHSYQISRLSNDEIRILTLMSWIDSVCRFPLYKSYADSYRIHKVSHGGRGRTEAIQLVQASIGGDNGQGMPGNNEKRSILSRIRSRFTN